MNLCGLAKIESNSSDYLSSHLGKLGFSVGLRHFGTDYLRSFTTIIDLSNSYEDLSRDFYALVKRKCARFAKYDYQYCFIEKNIKKNNWQEFKANHKDSYLSSFISPKSY